jgi:ribosomal protein S18 acetylase RimI-like enzyme
VEIVDVSRLEPRDLEPLWEREKGLWLERLYWDVSPAIAMVCRAAERKGLAGKAVRMGRDVVGYGYYLLEGHRAVLGSVVLASDADFPGVGSRLLGAILQSIKAGPAVQRIESQFVSFAGPWLAESFHQEGFTEYPRAFLRRRLRDLPVASSHPSFYLEEWSSNCLAEATVLLQQAHQGSVDAEMNELYRNRNGCRTLLDNILRLRGCGLPIAFASPVARNRETNAMNGLVIATEISPGHAHLAQIAVTPDAQGRGLGRMLVARALGSLAERGFRTVSLMVSGDNPRARSLYDSMGFEDVLWFPAFSWDSDIRVARLR